MKSCEQKVMRNSSAIVRKVSPYGHVLFDNQIKRPFCQSKKSRGSILFVKKDANLIKSDTIYFQSKINRPFPEDKILANRQKLIKQIEEERHTRNYKNATYF